MKTAIIEFKMGNSFSSGDIQPINVSNGRASYSNCAPETTARLVCVKVGLTLDPIIIFPSIKIEARASSEELNRVDDRLIPGTTHQSTFLHIIHGHAEKDLDEHIFLNNHHPQSPLVYTN